MKNDNMIKLKIVTPTGVFIDQDVSLVTVKTTEGYIGLQKNRMPFVASLVISDLKINPEGDKGHRVCAIDGGLIMATREKVEIITDGILYKEEIDIKRAEKQKARAELLLKTTKSESEHFRAQLALKKSLNKINVKKGL